MSLIDIIRKEFDSGNEITLQEIYEKISKNPEITITPDKIRHRIRSILYHLKKTNKIIRTKEATYKKVDKK